MKPCKRGHVSASLPGGRNAQGMCKECRRVVKPRRKRSISKRTAAVLDAITAAPKKTREQVKAEKAAARLEAARIRDEEKKIASEERLRKLAEQTARAKRGEAIFERDHPGAKAKEAAPTLSIETVKDNPLRAPEPKQPLDYKPGETFTDGSGQRWLVGTPRVDAQGQLRPTRTRLPAAPSEPPTVAQHPMHTPPATVTTDSRYPIYVRENRPPTVAEAAAQHARTQQPTEVGAQVAAMLRAGSTYDNGVRLPHSGAHDIWMRKLRLLDFNT